MSLLEVKHLSFAYDKKPILSDISFQISQGESFGIIGPNGSGKTTLIGAMSGFLTHVEGEVLLQGKAIAKYRKKELARLIAVVEQVGTPSISFTVEEVVAMGRYPWLKSFEQTSEKDIKLIHEALTTLDIWEKRYQPVNTLSGGERQLVSLARAMVQEPKVLILDEPTTYLDIGHQIMVMQHVRKWQRDKGLTVIMVLHDLNLAAQNCDRLLLLNHGKIQTLGTVAEVIDEKILEDVYQTKPIMIEHPVKKVPQILLLSL